jgi:hypothetical protein
MKKVKFRSKTNIWAVKLNNGSPIDHITMYRSKTNIAPQKKSISYDLGQIRRRRYSINFICFKGYQNK